MTDWLTDNFESRDASASKKNWQFAKKVWAKLKNPYQKKLRWSKKGEGGSQF